MEKIQTEMENIRENLSTKTSNSTKPSATSSTIPPSGSAQEVDISHIPAARRREWVMIIQSAFAVLMRDAPTGNRLKMQIRAFDEICIEIPVEVLRAVYVRSCEARDENGNLEYWDARLLLKTFRTSTDLREKAAGLLAKHTASSIASCRKCFGTGRIIKRDGRYEYSVKCDHEPIKSTDGAGRNREEKRI